MTCTKQIAELVESARQGKKLGRNAAAHMAGCSGCAERWEAEQQLTAEFHTLRVRATALMAHDTQRDVLLRDFAAVDFAGLRRWNVVRSWMFGLSAAAALAVVVVAGIFAGHLAGMRSPHKVSPTIRTHGTGSAEALFYEASSDASALSNDDFIAIPYSPPLAQGEIVRVVHAELYPQALASMGIDVDPVWTGSVPADVVVGEDGVPRAVRITENGQN